MSVSRPAQCLYTAFPKLVRSPASRCFHSSPARQSKPGPKHPNVKASDMGLVTPKDPNHLRPYSEEEKAALAKKYTSAQIAAIETGEKAIDPDDLHNQGAVRTDPMAVQYFDDFSKIHPVVDFAPLAPEENYDPDQRYKEADDFAGDLMNWVENLPEEADPVEWMKFADNNRLTIGKPEAELNPRSFVAPAIPKFHDVKAEGDAEEDPYKKRLLKTTNFTMEQLNRFRVKTLVQHRVVNQTRMGKIQSYYYLSVAGNRRGLMGIGEGKSTEPEDARNQSVSEAIRNMTPIPRYEDRTIYGHVEGKVGATELVLMSRPPGLYLVRKCPLRPLVNRLIGFGIRCQSLIYEICKCAGIEDLAARVTRSRNKMNTVKATVQALLGQRIPDDIARARGRKLVDVRKVYYAGLT
ncbi:MAG: 28S ribosomal protein S5, mitochondrial [Icmadophila ericetorum]|nr:28S ribosomal protein S5, mitochondrial [Icmadophila ericetorum]